MGDDGDGNNHQASSSSSSSTFLQHLAAKRTALVEVKQEQGQQITMDHASDGIISTNNDDHHRDPDGHLCVVCMDTTSAGTCTCRATTWRCALSATRTS